MAIKISLGPVLYYWSEEQLRTFYRQVATAPVDIVYLGETICSKRRSLSSEQWIEIGHELQAAGKEVVLSTLALLEAESELKQLRKICKQENFLVEANDLAAVNIRSKAATPFVVGHSINLYNQATLALLARAGMSRWVLPVELSRETLSALQQDRPEGIETEVFGWGRLPLAYAARCYTARHHGLPKDECELRCLDDPDGMVLKTKEGQPFLTLNGVQTQSAQHHNLIGAVDEMTTLGVDIVRISPQSHFTMEVVQLFDQVRREVMSGAAGKEATARYLPYGGVDGYWYGKAGIE
ncbi:MAG: U32 family peptidase [Gammaproteobacteria bacterium]|jgi:O2-independent ubiquinone biosynthesis protein UbiV|nr:U32 family peptidase [Gammaproteobacteria bacterium]